MNASFSAGPGDAGDRPPVRRRAVALLVAALACAAGYAAPAANAAPADEGGIPVAVTPAGPGGALRVGFDLTAAPGAVIEDEVTITNLSNEPKIFQVYAADAFNTAEGRFDVLTPDRPSTNVGSWVKLEAAAVSLAPKAKTSVPFSITVPKDAAPGDHVGGIVASTASELPSETGGTVQVNRRAGARIYLRVNGAMRTSLEYRLTDVHYGGGLNPFGGDVEIRYAVRNTGNTVVAGEQRIDVGGLLQGTKRIEKLPLILPGYEVTLTATVGGVRPFGRASVRTDLVGQKSATDATQVTAAQTAERGIWAVSWLLVVVLLVVVAGAVTWFVLRRRRRAPEEEDVAEQEPARL